MNNWVDEGQVYAVTSLGSLSPQHGSKMFLMTTGALSINHTSSSIKQKITLPQGAQKLSFKYDFISREYPDYVGSQFNDQFEANLLTKNGIVHIDSMEVNNPKANFQPTTVNFPNEDASNGKMGHTGWRSKEINLSGLTGDVILAFTVSDVGDSIYDTGVLIDDINITTSVGGIKFLSSPLSGIAIANLPITSVFDHNNIPNDVSIPFMPNGIVVAYTGEKGQGKIGTPGFAPCLDNVEIDNITKKPKNFVINGNYKGGNSGLKNELCYDGHDGIDFQTTANIIAAADGTASFDWANDLFHTIDIKVNGNGYTLRYLHLNTNTFGKSKGTVPVVRGQIIGTAGGWGKCYYDPITQRNVGCNSAFGTHLHFTVLNPQSQRVDPYGWKGNSITPTDPMSSTVKNINLWIE